MVDPPLPPCASITATTPRDRSSLIALETIVRDLRVAMVSVLEGGAAGGSNPTEVQGVAAGTVRRWCTRPMWMQDAQFAALGAVRDDEVAVGRGGIGPRERTTSAVSGVDLWLVAEMDTPLAMALLGRPCAVLLTFADARSGRYAAVVGVAEALRDAARLRRMWNLHATAWFQGGLEDPNLGLIRVRGTEAEYWDGPSRIGHTLDLLRGEGIATRPGDCLEIPRSAIETRVRNAGNPRGWGGGERQSAWGL